MENDNLCHFPQISGISSSVNELDTYPHSKYIWPIIPHISGLTVLITINIWGSHTVFPIYGIGHLLHVACVISIRVSGHCCFPEVDWDTQSLLSALSNILSPALDPQMWKWPETLLTRLAFLTSCYGPLPPFGARSDAALTTLTPVSCTPATSGNAPQWRTTSKPAHSSSKLPRCGSGPVAPIWSDAAKGSQVCSRDRRRRDHRCSTDCECT
jgi:hypothetical protein